MRNKSLKFVSLKKMPLQCVCVCVCVRVCARARAQVRGHVGGGSFLPPVAVRDPAYFRLGVL